MNETTDIDKLAREMRKIADWCLSTNFAEFANFSAEGVRLKDPVNIRAILVDREAVIEQLMLTQRLLETSGTLAQKEIDALKKKLVEAERENFALAANQCHAGYGDEYGNHCCREQDALKAKLAEAQAEISVWKSVFPDIAPESVLPDRSLVEAENVALRARLAELATLSANPEALLNDALDCIRPPHEKTQAEEGQS